MVIVLYDNEHFETLETWIRVLNTGAHQLHVLVPDALRKRLVDKGIEASGAVSFYRAQESPRAHPSVFADLCKSTGARLGILATVSFQHWLFARAARKLRGTTRIVLGVHDVRDFFEPVLRPSLRGAVRYWGKKRLVRAAGGFAVLLEEMRSFLINRYSEKRPVYVVPGSVYVDSGNNCDADLPLKIVIPGSVDTRRRNYDDLRILLKQFDTAAVAFQLAGGVAEGQQSPAWLDEIPAGSWSSEGFMPIKDFDRMLAESNIVWLPLQRVFHRPDGGSEEYGRTKSAGGFFDAIRHGKPLLLPDGIPVPEMLATATIQYADAQHLRYLLEALTGNAAARYRLCIDARKAAGRFSLSEVRARTLPQLLTGN